MPRVPQFTPQVGMPAGTGQAPANERPFVDPFAGQQKLARAVDDVADITNKIAEADTRRKYFEAHIDLGLMTAQLEDAFSRRNDYENFPSDLETSQRDALENLRQKYGSAFDAIQPRIKQAFGIQRIRIGHLARQTQVRSIKAGWMDAGDMYAGFIGRTDDPDDRAALLGAYEKYTGEMRDSLVIDDVEAQRAIHAMRAKSSMTAFKMDLQRDSGEAQRRLVTERETHYPHMSPDDELKAGNLIEIRQREQERKINAERKEIHNLNAKTAYDGYLSWKKGKNGGFQEWLMQARETDQISEGTFQMYTNKIERAADRAATGERKMTAADWIAFGKVKAEFMTPGSDKSWDDIGALSNRFPNSRISELVNIVAKQPSTTRKALISNNWGYVSKRLSEGKASADTWKETNDKWNVQLEVTADADIPKLAKELVKEIPQGGFSPMLDQLRKEKEAQKQKPGFFKSLFKFNPSTGQLEGGKK